MKKKNLIILLMFPFIIAMLCIVTINTTYNMVDVDISYIDWDYNDMEAFEISEGLYPLKATGVNQRHYEVVGGSNLVWTVANKDGTDEPYAEIVKSGGQYFLKALKSGEAIITCSNQKGNVYRQLTAVIYKDSAIMLYPTITASGSNIDSTVYYGEYDHKIGTMASIDMTVVAVPSGILPDLYAETSDNVSFDISTGVISVNAPGDAYITIKSKDDIAKPTTFRFHIVDEGVNVYTYEDLLYCTNSSDSGHIAVLRKHFESLENAYYLDSNGKPILNGGEPLMKANNVECFGNYSFSSGKFSFASDIYSFKSTYNTEFIDAWNAFCETDGKYSKINDIVNVGLHIQQDFYGNGYTVNLHNLTYPYQYTNRVINGVTVRIPELTSDNIFRGPLKMYSLGDPSNTPLVSVYGQDNIGMYVEGDGITVNDVNLKNCDFGDRLANLETVGTVLEVYGSDILIENSRISNGKNVIRSFSSQDLVIDNCLISNAMNFLFLTGSNEYIPIDGEAVKAFTALDDSTVVAAINDYLAKGGKGDDTLNSFLQDYFTTQQEKDAMRKALESIQSALCSSDLSGQYKGSATINDTYFYQSGIASICMETLFNSPFLESASPSLIGDLFSLLSSESKTLVPYIATGTSGISYPVYLELTGSTKFYDYKSTDAVDLSGLIEENISSTANSLNLYDGTIDIDTIFPLRTMLIQRAKSLGCLVNDSEDGKSYVNIPVAFYGGGLNLSRVVFNTDSEGDHFSSEVEVDLLNTYLSLKGTSGGDILSQMKGVMLKTVTTVTGFEPFKFVLGEDMYLYGEYPQVADLIENAKQK